MSSTQEPQASGPTPDPPRSGGTPQPLSLHQQVEQAERRAREMAYLSHRQAVRKRLGAETRLTSGTFGCLWICLIPLGLLLLLIQPIAGVVVLSLGALFFLLASDRMRASRGRQGQADLEAERSWRDAQRLPDSERGRAERP
ncbi:MAG: hypothetical protein VKI83_10460 [Synechococcaceae cyanobacterium]|nr:hypothetical protein [Synechococcaceae cyanobacterium]